MGYDAIIIGTGQAGPSLAAGLAERGARVAVVEGHLVGGSCVNYGCTPTKTILASARVAHLARRAGDFGLRTGPVSVDFPAVMARKDERVEASRTGLVDWLEGLETVDLLRAWARFEGSEDGRHRVRAGEALLEAERVYLNTGTRPIVPPIEGLDEQPHLDSEGLLSLEALPAQLVVLGGGSVGLEMAQAFRRFGSEVTVLEAEDRVAQDEDEDVSEALRKILEDEGVRILTERRAASVGPGADGGIEVGLQIGAGDGDGDGDGAEETVRGSHLLVAVGRRPNSDRLGLETVGVETDDRGYIVVDGHLRTSVEGIYALGDVNGAGGFTHTAYQDHEIVLDNLRGGERERFRSVPYAIYTDPPLGRIGMSEREARASGRPLLGAVKPMTHVGRALEQGETKGFMKVLVDGETERFLGAAILGYRGDEVIQVIGHFMATDRPVSLMRQTLPIHPTVAEQLPTILGELQPL